MTRLLLYSAVGGCGGPIRDLMHDGCDQFFVIPIAIIVVIVFIVVGIIFVITVAGLLIAFD